MNNPILSICLPVYNQSEMVIECINEILKYEDNEIEVVINDDCSNENIKELIEKIGDSRLRYFKNSTNLGHDLNILQSFRNSRSQYAFLLRVRDRIIPSGISSIIDRIKKNPNLAYLTGQAVDESGDIRLAYNIGHYKKGDDAINAHMKLYLHPSGSLYSIDLIDLDRAEKFIKERFDHKFGFLVHSMLRLELALKGDFEILTDTIWQYNNTLKASDVAVNSTKNKESVYAPKFVINRYYSEMEWACKIVPEHKVVEVYKWLSFRYLDSLTWGFKRRNEDINIQKHYNAYKMEFSMKDERKNFMYYTKLFSDKHIKDSNSKAEFFDFINKIMHNNKTRNAIRFYLAKYLRVTPVYKIYSWFYIHRRDTSREWKL